MQMNYRRQSTQAFADEEGEGDIGGGLGNSDEEGSAEEEGASFQEARQQLSSRALDWSEEEEDEAIDRLEDSFEREAAIRLGGGLHEEDEAWRGDEEDEEEEDAGVQAPARRIATRVEALWQAGSEHKARKELSGARMSSPALLEPDRGRMWGRHEPTSLEEMLGRRSLPSNISLEARDWLAEAVNRHEEEDSIEGSVEEKAQEVHRKGASMVDRSSSPETSSGKSLEVARNAVWEGPPAELAPGEPEARQQPTLNLPAPAPADVQAPESRSLLLGGSALGLGLQVQRRADLAKARASPPPRAARSTSPARGRVTFAPEDEIWAARGARPRATELDLLAAIPDAQPAARAARSSSPQRLGLPPEDEVWAARGARPRATELDLLAATRNGGLVLEDELWEAASGERAGRDAEQAFLAWQSGSPRRRAQADGRGRRARATEKDFLALEELQAARVRSASPAMVEEEHQAGGGAHRATEKEFLAMQELKAHLSEVRRKVDDADEDELLAAGAAARAATRAAERDFLAACGTLRVHDEDLVRRGEAGHTQQEAAGVVRSIRATEQEFLEALVLPQQEEYMSAPSTPVSTVSMPTMLTPGDGAWATPPRQAASKPVSMSPASYPSRIRPQRPVAAPKGSVHSRFARPQAAPVVQVQPPQPPPPVQSAAPQSAAPCHVVSMDRFVEILHRHSWELERLRNDHEALRRDHEALLAECRGGQQPALWPGSPARAAANSCLSTPPRGTIPAFPQEEVRGSARTTIGLGARASSLLAGPPTAAVGSQKVRARASAPAAPLARSEASELWVNHSVDGSQDGAAALPSIADLAAPERTSAPSSPRRTERLDRKVQGAGPVPRGDGVGEAVDAGQQCEGANAVVSRGCSPMATPAPTSATSPMTTPRSGLSEVGQTRGASGAASSKEGAAEVALPRGGFPEHPGGYCTSSWRREGQPADLFKVAKPLLERESGLQAQARALKSVEFSLHRGASPSSWRGPGTPLRSGVHAQSVPLVKALLRARGDPNEEGPQRVRLLHLAAASSQEEMCRTLLEARADANATDGHGQTPLFFAPSPAMCELLQAGRADLSAINDHGQSALHVAATAGQGKTVLWLARRASRALVALRDIHGFTALDYAKRTGMRLEVLEALTQAAEAPANAPGKRGREVLLGTASDFGERPTSAGSRSTTRTGGTRRDNTVPVHSAASSSAQPRPSQMLLEGEVMAV